MHAGSFCILVPHCLLHQHSVFYHTYPDLSFLIQVIQPLIFLWSNVVVKIHKKDNFFKIHSQHYILLLEDHICCMNLTVTFFIFYLNDFIINIFSKNLLISFLSLFSLLSCWLVKSINQSIIYNVYWFGSFLYISIFPYSHSSAVLLIFSNLSF